MVALESGFRIVDGNGVRWFGVALFIVGGVLRLWPIFTLQGRCRWIGGNPART